jgi:hypothetical protein
MDKRLFKEESREKGSFDGTEVNWAEDHASFRVSLHADVSSLTRVEWEYRVETTLMTSLLTAFVLV